MPPPPNTARLQVNLRGGVAGFRKAQVTGPNGLDSGLFEFHEPFMNLTPGQYTIVGNTFTVGRGTPDCNTYTPEVVGSPQTLAAGQIGEATVNFIPESCN